MEQSHPRIIEASASHTEPGRARNHDHYSVYDVTLSCEIDGPHWHPHTCMRTGIEGQGVLHFNSIIAPLESRQDTLDT